jgi:sulfatase modifying factor 1
VTVKQNLNHNNPKNQYLVNYASNQPMDKYLTIPLPNNVLLEMILVKPGHFIMGDEKGEAWTGETHKHLVHITEPFYIGKYPVTQKQWQALVGSTPSDFVGPQRPVENVSWLDIVEGNQNDNGKPAFLVQLNNYLSVKRPDLAATDKFRLPTEAEWEYAAKGGPRYALAELKDKKAAKLYSAYAGGDRLETCGWYRENNGIETRPVGLKAPNELGLYDMSGNVLEWCQDWFDSDTYSNRKEPVPKNPVGPESGVYRVLRGGHSWDYAGYCRSSFRYLYGPSFRYVSFGFRLVLSPSSGSGTSGYP